MTENMLAMQMQAWVRDPRFFYRPHRKQLDFHAAGGVPGGSYRERLFLAGNRVGKTLAGVAEVCFHLTGLYPAWWQGVRFERRPVEAWAASVTREATRDILQRMYVGSAAARPGAGRQRALLPAGLVLGMTRKGGVTGAVDEVRVRHVSGGTSVLGFKSFDQGRASFQGTRRDVIHLDEEPDIGIYEECLLRTLLPREVHAAGENGGYILLTMTPLMGLTEMVRHFTESSRTGGKIVIQAGWDDTAHLPESEKKRLRASLRPHEMAAREHGLPQLGRGRVFPVEEGAITCARFAIPADWKQCFGLDFGWSNPTAAVWLAYDRVNDVVYLTDIYTRSEATPVEHAREMLRRGAWIPGVCDPAGQAANQRDGRSLVSLYEQAGLRLETADNDVEAGLMALLERMRSGRFMVFSDLAGWWHEFRHYARDARGRIIKRDDHLLDATRYALLSGLPLARSGAPPVWVQPRQRDWRTV